MGIRTMILPEQNKSTPYFIKIYKDYIDDKEIKKGIFF